MTDSPEQLFRRISQVSTQNQSTTIDFKLDTKRVRHKRLRSLDSPKQNSPKKLDLLKDFFNAPLLNVQEEIQTQDIPSIDQIALNIPTFSNQATNMYQTIYKQFDNLFEKQQFYNSSRVSVYSSMIQKTQPGTEKKLLPRKLNVIKNKSSSQQILNINYFQMGDSYASLLGAGLTANNLKNLKEIRLQNNRFTAQGANLLFQQLPKNIKFINLENNFIGRFHNESSKFIESLNTRFHKQDNDNFDYNLQVLNLENNQFTDETAKILFIHLSSNKKIKILNLSRNRISDGSSKELAEMINKNNQIKELYLHWNQLHSQSGTAITSALYKNTTIRVLDLSQNSLGIQNYVGRIKIENENMRCGNVWGDYFSNEQCNLLHIDLSYNKFSPEDTKIIAQRLDNNHTIFGIHFRGNGQNRIDHNGFLLSDDKQKVSKAIRGEILIENFKKIKDGMPKAPISERRINGVQPVVDFKHPPEQLENCWICEGWVEHQFFWEPTSMDFKTEPIFIHFSHERYIPVLMKQCSSVNSRRRSSMSRKLSILPQQKWMVKRMIPSNREIKFFFSSPLIQISSISRYYGITQWDQSEVKKQVIFYTTEGESIKFCRPEKANRIKVEYQKIMIEKDYGFIIQIESVPRIKDLDGMLKLNNKIEEEHQEENFFSNYHPDGDEDYEKCFEYDWNKGNLDKLISNPQDKLQTKEFLFSIYRDLFSTYRQYSSYSQMANCWCITLNSFTELFSQVIVDKNYQQKDLDFIFKSWQMRKTIIFYSTSKFSSITRPQAQLALLRFQLLEILVELAIDKYVRRGICQTVCEAVEKIYEEDGLDDKLEEAEESQEWRDLNFWNAQCNKVILENLGGLQTLYKIGVENRQLNYFTTKQFLTPQAFRELVGRVKLINDNLGERQINLAFNLSTPLVMDEIGTDRNLQLQFIEFIESIARLSEKINFKNIPEGKKEDQFAWKLNQVITNMFGSYYINKTVNGMTKDQKQQEIRRKMQNQKTQFITVNAAKIIYELDGSPDKQNDILYQ